MLLGRTRHCNYLHNCPGSRRTIHLGSCRCRTLHSSRARGLQAGDLAQLSVARAQLSVARVGTSVVETVAQEGTSVVETVPVASARTIQQP